MTVARRLARFVVQSSYDDLSENARLQTKIRILGSIGCALGALFRNRCRVELR
jgi:2-methylcitrate dehydratase